MAWALKTVIRITCKFQKLAGVTSVQGVLWASEGENLIRGKMDWEVTVLEGKGIDKVFSVVFVVVFSPRKKIETGLLALRCFRKETYGKEWRLHCWACRRPWHGLQCQLHRLQLVQLLRQLPKSAWRHFRLWLRISISGPPCFQTLFLWEPPMWGPWARKWQKNPGGMQGRSLPLSMGLDRALVFLSICEVRSYSGIPFLFIAMFRM